MQEQTVGSQALSPVAVRARNLSRAPHECSTLRFSFSLLAVQHKRLSEPGFPHFSFRQRLEEESERESPSKGGWGGGYINPETIQAAL